MYYYLSSRHMLLVETLHPGCEEDTLAEKCYLPKPAFALMPLHDSFPDFAIYHNTYLQRHQLGEISTTGTWNLKISITSTKKTRKIYIHTSASSTTKKCFFSPRNWTLIIHWYTVPVYISDESNCLYRTMALPDNMELILQVTKLFSFLNKFLHYIQFIFRSWFNSSGIVKNKVAARVGKLIFNVVFSTLTHYQKIIINRIWFT